MPRVTIFTRCKKCYAEMESNLFPECSHCDNVRTFFEDRNVVYEEVDVSIYQDKLKGSGKMFENQFPLTRINDKFISGFDKEKLERLLDKYKHL